MNILEFLGAFPILGFGLILVLFSVVLWRIEVWPYRENDIWVFAFTSIILYMVGSGGLCVTGLGLFMLVDGLV